MLFLYGENARIKLKDLAVGLKKSSQLLKHTTERLVTLGVLRLPHAIIDYSQCGLLLFRVYFKGAYISDRDKAAIMQELAMNPYVTATYELEGEFDLVAEFMTPNPSRFNKEIKKLASIIPTLNNYKVLLTVVTHIYPRFYLPRNPLLIELVGNEVIVGGDRKVVDFNSEQLGILKSVAVDPQIRYSTLASRVGINIKTATKMLHTLEKDKIIRGYRYTLAVSKLGGFHFRLFLNLHNVSAERESDLNHYFLRCKEVVQMSKTIGDWDVEVDIEALDKSKVRFLTLEIREKFKDIIQSFNMMEIYDSYSRKYLPDSFFEDGKELKELKDSKEVKDSK